MWCTGVDWVQTDSDFLCASEGYRWYADVRYVACRFPIVLWSVPPVTSQMTRSVRGMDIAVRILNERLSPCLGALFNKDDIFQRPPRSRYYIFMRLWVVRYLYGF